MHFEFQKKRLHGLATQGKKRIKRQFISGQKEIQIFNSKQKHLHIIYIILILLLAKYFTYIHLLI